MNSGHFSARLWLARALIVPVFGWNLQCALAFLITPADYASGFELAGAPGAAMVRAMGLLFLMWNVPYAVALWQPFRHRVSLCEAVAMQAVGLAGEALILWSLGSGHAQAAATALRFIAFDSAGLALLALALALPPATAAQAGGSHHLERRPSSRGGSPA